MALPQPQGKQATPKIMVIVDRGEVEGLRVRLATADVDVSLLDEQNGRGFFRCLDPDGIVVEVRESAPT
jgi:hypothetical protein